MQKKIENLRTYFGKEYGKEIENKPKSGSGAAQTFKGELKPNFNENLNKSLNNLMFSSKHETCSRKIIFEKKHAKVSKLVSHVGLVPQSRKLSVDCGVTSYRERRDAHYFTS